LKRYLFLKGYTEEIFFTDLKYDYNEEQEIEAIKNIITKLRSKMIDEKMIIAKCLNKGYPLELIKKEIKRDGE